MNDPHFVHFVRVGASSLIFESFLDAAVDFDVLYLGVAIFNLFYVRFRGNHAGSSTNNIVRI